MAMAAVKLVAAFSLAVSLTLSPGMACPGGRGATNMQTKFKPGTCASRQNYSTTCCPLIHCKAEDGDCYCDNNCFPNRDCCADVHCVKREYIMQCAHLDLAVITTSTTMSLW